MSGIAGVFYRDGRPAQRETIEAMMRAIAHRGPDGNGLWVEGPVGFGFNNLHTTPESLEEVQPLHDWESGDHLICDARIDNRDDVRRELLTLGHRLKTNADGELVLRAWQQWGEDCPMKFEGDFAIAVWNHRTQRLWCARDHLGCRTFYCYSSPKLFAFASEIKALLRLAEIPRVLDEEHLLTFLVLELDGSSQESTYFKGIRRLPGGHWRSIIRADERQMDYWPLAETKTVPYRDINECAEAFRAVFEDTVRKQLRHAKPLAITLSGGLDSGSIVALARGPLRDVAGSPLKTISLVGHKGMQCPEAKGIQAMIDMGGLDPTILTPDSVKQLSKPLSSLISRVDDPSSLILSFSYLLTYAFAAASGSRVVLDGVDGDLLFPSGARLASILVRQGHFVQAVREITVAHGMTGDRITALKSSLLPSLAPGFYLWYKRLAHLFQDIDKDSLATAYMCRRWSVDSRILEVRAQHLQSLRSLAASQDLLFRRRWMSCFVEWYAELGFQESLEPRHPLLSRPVVSFSAGLPPGVLTRSSKNKPVLRLGMGDLLPGPDYAGRSSFHPGHQFGVEFLRGWKSREDISPYECKSQLADFVDLSRFVNTSSSGKIEWHGIDENWSLVCLALWLDCHMR